MRQATVLYQVQDAEGYAWDVKEERPTSHGWLLLLGWPTRVPRGKGGCGGPGTIPTSHLVDYMTEHRMGKIELPIGTSTIKRLRRVLGHHRYRDAEQWWMQHIMDLMEMTCEEFAATHSVSAASVSMWRRRITGEQRARLAGWWRTPEVIALAKTDISTYALAHTLDISTSLAWALKHRVQTLEAR
jgi:hypothetical protein